MRAPLRIAFLTVMPAPYVQDMFAAMAADDRFRLHVSYLEMVAPDTYWGQVALPAYAEILTGQWWSFMGGRIHYNPRAATQLLAHDPDVVVVGGYSGLTNQIVMRQLRRRRVPWIFWGEMPGMIRRGRMGQALRYCARWPAVRWPSAIAAIGSRAADSYRRLAADHCPVVNIPYCCDLQPFLERPHVPADSGRVRFLYCGQLIERKGVDLLLLAFFELARELPQVTLTLVGEGPLRKALHERVPTEHRDRVIFAGFQTIEQLPRFFADADVFVLPSRHDGWGVVVNQAVAAGLTVICSDAVGAAADLVQPGRNGYVFPSGDRSRLLHYLQELSRHPESLKAGQEVSRQISLEWTPQRAAQRWFELGSRVSAADKKTSIT